MNCIIDTPLIASVADLVTISGGLFAITIAVWQFRLYRSLSENENTIKAKQKQIDVVSKDMQRRTSQSLVDQSQLDRLIENEQAPLKYELELLKRDRKFILDKLLFTNKK